MDSAYQRQQIAQRTAEMHAEQAEVRDALQARGAASKRPVSAAEQLPEDDPAFDREKAIIARIMNRSHDDLKKKYPIVGEPIPSVRELIEGKKQALLAAATAANRSRSTSTASELNATTVEGLRRVGSSLTRGDTAFNQSSNE
jgi:hypothetical protein